MAKSRSLQQAVRFALATAAAGISALHAQEAPAPAAAPVEEVVVTGSRLQTPNETSISPITTVSAVDLQQTGLTRVEDVLNNLPMVFAGMNSTTSNGADGTSVVNLRGLGSTRTLVLVNGKRLGPGSALLGRNFSDINQVPAALIERVDVLTGGASAVYGADAVAGVVNFILNTVFHQDPRTWIQDTTQLLGLIPINNLALIGAATWGIVGFAMVILSAALKGIPGDLLEAARVDGAGEITIFRRVIFPLMMPTVVVVGTTLVIFALKAFDVVYAMTAGNYDTDVLANRMYKLLYFSHDLPGASAVAVILLLTVIPVLIFNLRQFRAVEARR